MVVPDGGVERKIAVLGEPFKDVSPGEIPRTVDELRQGIERTETPAMKEVSRRIAPLPTPEDSNAQENATVEDFLDNLLNEASEDEDTQVGCNDSPIVRSIANTKDL